MGITAYGKELRPRLRMESPLDKIQGFLSEQITIPKNVFGGLDHEKNERQSSTKRDVIIVRSKDRETDRDEILRNLRQAGITAQLGSGGSSVDPIDGTHEGKNFRILVKPMSGGMAETTLNASITELFPCIAFELNHVPQLLHARLHKLLKRMSQYLITKSDWPSGCVLSTIPMLCPKCLFELNRRLKKPDFS